MATYGFCENKCKQELDTVKVSPTEPTTKENVWIQRGKNLFKDSLINGLGNTDYNNGTVIQKTADTNSNPTWKLMAYNDYMVINYALPFLGLIITLMAQIYVNNTYENAEGISAAQLTAAQDLAYTYMVILESRKVLDDVAERTNLGYSTNQIKNMIRSQAMNGTEVFKVTVTNTDYRHAAAIANSIAEVLPDKIAAVVEGSSVRVVDYAVENSNPVGPDYENYLMMGALIGFAVSTVIFVIADILDTTIKTEEYIAHVYSDIPLLAVIPSTNSEKYGHGKGYYKGYYEYTQSTNTAAKSGGAKK